MSHVAQHCPLDCFHRLSPGPFLLTTQILFLVPVGHMGELCKNGWSDRDAVWGLTRVGPMNHVLDVCLDPQQEGALEGHLTADCNIATQECAAHCSRAATCCGWMHSLQPCAKLFPCFQPYSIVNCNVFIPESESTCAL